MSMSTLYAPLGSLFQAQGENCETTSYIHQHLQNSKNSGRFERQSSTSIAETSHEGKFFQRQKFVIKVSQEYFGRPLRLCPFGCQVKTLLIQRCPGSVAKYCAKFQWCLRQISDHDLDPVCEVKARTRSFQMWRIFLIFFFYFSRLFDRCTLSSIPPHPFRIGVGAGLAP